MACCPDCMSSGSACLSRSDRLVQIVLCSARACSYVPCWILDLSSGSFSLRSSLLQSASLLSDASSASWHSDSMDFAFSAHLIGLVFDLPSAHVSAFFCSIACRSPIIVLSAPKHCSGSGFIRQSTMFTSVSIFVTSSFFSITSS